MDYLDWLLKQRRGGPVPLTDIDLNRDDLTIIDVPSTCMGFITGRKGERHCARIQYSFHRTDIVN